MEQELVKVVVKGNDICVDVYTDSISYTRRFYPKDKWTVASAVNNAIMEEAYQNFGDVEFYTDEEFDKFENLD